MELAVVGTAPGLVNQSQATRRTVDKDVTGSSNHVSEEAPIGGVESSWGLDSTSRTQRKTLELASKIRKKPLKVLIDLGSTSNYTSAQECAARSLHIDPGRACERGELRMANGSMVQTAGSVKILLKCGAYCGVIEAMVFLGLDKPMILGIPWLRKENPHIDWTRSAMVVQQKNQWISLHLVQKTNPSAYLVNEISANEAQMMFHRVEMQEAFLGFVRCVNE